MRTEFSTGAVPSPTIRRAPSYTVTRPAAGACPATCMENAATPRSPSIRVVIRRRITSLLNRCILPLALLRKTSLHVLREERDQGKLVEPLPRHEEPVAEHLQVARVQRPKRD